MDGEERWHTIGAVAAGSIFKVLLVVRTYPNPDDETWIRVISLRETDPLSGNDMKNTITKRSMPSYPLTQAQIEQLRALEGRAPDTADIPPAPDANWATVVRGKHSAATQGTLAIRLDDDVLAWLLAKGPGYATEINRILRERMAAETVG